MVVAGVDWQAAVKGSGCRAVSGRVRGCGGLRGSGGRGSGGPPARPIMTVVIAIGVGSALLFGASIAARETWTIPSARARWIAFAYLGVVRSIVVFLLDLFVLRLGKLRGWRTSTT